MIRLNRLVLLYFGHLFVDFQVGIELRVYQAFTIGLVAFEEMFEIFSYYGSPGSKVKE